MSLAGSAAARLSSQSPDVSIVIRVRNAEKWLPYTLSHVFDQSFDGTFEVIIVENESTDKSLEICKRFPTRIIHISRQDFTFGRSVNLGCQAARGQFVAILSQDAIPMGRYWLQTLMDYCNQPGVAACSGVRCWGQLPGQTLRFSPRVLKREDYDRQIERMCGVPNWHTVTSMMRRQVWAKHQFNEELPMGDDNEWACRVVRAGWTVVIGVPAIVQHQDHDDWHQLRSRRYWGSYTCRHLGWTPTAGGLAGVLFQAAVKSGRVARSLARHLVKTWIIDFLTWDGNRLADRVRASRRPPWLLKLRPPRPDAQPIQLGLAPSRPVDQRSCESSLQSGANRDRAKRA